MDGLWEKILKEAKICHSKQSWEVFFLKYELELSTSNSSKPLNEIFRLLHVDPQSLQYNPDIFGILLKGCLASWDLELGQLISAFVAPMSNPSCALHAAQIYLESGEPLKARNTALRAIRLSNETTANTLRLNLIVCSSYAEEGKQSKLDGLIAKTEQILCEVALDPKDSADIKVQMARIQFFLGRYIRSGELFKQAADIYVNLEEWEAAAKALFNTAACAHNGGDNSISAAFAFVEESRRISEKHDLKGPLSHCEAFYGLEAFQRGNFAEAREFFRRAIDFLPSNDKSYRRLHILSMLTLTYLASGHYSLAKRYGQQTLDLAALDKSQRYRSRYISLEAELKWENGDPLESQKVLARAITNFEAHGINNLEELSSYSRYISQSAVLGETTLPEAIPIREGLKKQLFTYFDYQFSVGQLRLTQGRFNEAQEIFSNIHDASAACDDRYHIALALLGTIQIKLSQHAIDQELEKKLFEFRIIVRRIGDTPLHTQLQIAQAAVAYQIGDFKECTRILRSVAHASKTSFADQFAIHSWLSTVEGHSGRLVNPWQEAIVARMTRLYFAPSITVASHHVFEISRHYHVDLSRYPALSDLLTFLLMQPTFSASTGAIQTDVWRQSLNTVGWQQKIRNAIMRLRGMIPYTMAPLVLHNNDICLFSAAIAIQLPKHEGTERTMEINRLLTRQRMTSTQLSARLQSSPATIKRILKKMVEQNQISGFREGRNIYYTINTDGPDFRPSL